jgi:BTB/POZ domain
VIENLLVSSTSCLYIFPASLTLKTNNMAPAVGTKAMDVIVKSETSVMPEDRFEAMTTSKMASTQDLAAEELTAVTAAGKGMKAVKMAAMPKAANLPKTIRFNVGGKDFEISRSTLELYPHTMLARIAAAAWTGGKCHDPSDPVFIDRDGDLFRYVLNYMRNNGEVSLPMTESKQSFLKEMEYYGFDMVNEDCVALGTIAEAHKIVASASGNFQDDLSKVNASIYNWKKSIKSLEEKVREAEGERKGLKIADMLFQRSIHRGECSDFTMRIDDEDHIRNLKCFLPMNVNYFFAIGSDDYSGDDDDSDDETERRPQRILGTDGNINVHLAKYGLAVRAWTWSLTPVEYCTVSLERTSHKRRRMDEESEEAEEEREEDEQQEEEDDEEEEGYFSD